MMQPYISKIGVIDKTNAVHKHFANTYLDYKRETECAVTYELYRSGNYVLAVLHSAHVNNIINEQMHIKTA